MDDERASDGGGRAVLIFVAVVVMVLASGAAAWSTMGEGSSAGSSASSGSDTQVLGKRIEARTTGASNASPATTTAVPAVPTSSTTTTAAITSTGRFVAARGTGAVRGSGEVHTYSVEAEEGSGVDPDALAAIVDVILQDPRGWTAQGYGFQRVPAGGDFTISLSTPTTADKICLPLDTAGKFSCHEGHRVVLNLTRWNQGTTDLALDINGYRAEVVNHEIGHELGLDHVGCGGTGIYAPVMMQQSKGLDGCVANPWPTLDLTAPG